jgi:FkbM family methyltransferase
VSQELEAEQAAVRAFLESTGKPGFFVEVGANAPTSVWSQTWHLEQRGWTGILVEPVQQLYELCVRERPGSKVVRAACTSSDKVGKLTLQIPLVDGVSRTELAGTEIGVDEPVATAYDTQVVPAVTLDSILDQQGAPTPDFVSIDVEGSEIDVLRGFDLARWRPRLLLIEDKWVYFDKHRFLTQHGYRLVKRTGPNSWYVPAGTPFTHTAFPQRLRMYWKLYVSTWWRKLRKARQMRSLRPLRHL